MKRDPEPGVRLTRRSFLQGAAAASWSAVRLAAAAADPQPALDGPTDTEEDAAVADLLSRMSLEEKLGQLNQALGRVSDTDASLPKGSEELIRAGRVGSFLSLHGAEETRRLQRIAVEESRLGVPLLFASDVIHGFRTIFPVPLAEAASFDVAAVETSARIAATEAAAHGLHWTFAPMVDIARDPRWGRIVEGSGEDPCLGAALAAARVRGFQGQDLRADDTVLATAKHFVAYGAAEGGRDYNTADLSLRTLHEIYLPPFRAAVEAGVQSIMASFNEIGGVPMHANRDLIRGLLREQWAFNGIVVSDYTGIRELMVHGVAANPEAAGIRALEAGVDVDMVSGIYAADLPAAVLGKRLAEAEVDQAVRRVLRSKFRLGLLQDPYRYCDPTRERTRSLTPQHRAAAREVARKSLVLLKNEGRLLPLSPQLRRIAVIGPMADDHQAMLGSWAAAGRPEDVITPLEGLRAAAPAGMQVLYAKGASAEGMDTTGFAEAEHVARRADAVLIFVGEPPTMTGEARSRSSLDLPGVQEALVRRLQPHAKRMVVVLFGGRPLSIKWIAETVPSILLAWFPGVEAGPAVADVLFGAHNPAGRLPVTFPRSVGQIPIYYNHKNTGRPAKPDVDNTSKYLDSPSTPLFAFGHGLSYTTFSYQNLQLGTSRIGPHDALDVSFEVMNTGGRAGDEVVQLYLRDAVASITRPVKQLRRFERIHLKPGESRQMQFKLGPDDLAFPGSELRPVVEPGTFTVMVGGNSTDLLEERFEVEER